MVLLSLYFYSRSCKYSFQSRRNFRCLGADNVLLFSSEVGVVCWGSPIMMRATMRSPGWVAPTSSRNALVWTTGPVAHLEAMFSEWRLNKTFCTAAHADAYWWKRKKAAKINEMRSQIHSINHCIPANINNTHSNLPKEQLHFTYIFHFSFCLDRHKR